MDVRTLCLGVLSERAMSGYEIKKHFEEAFRHFFVAGFGSIYPALAELARGGLVTVEDVEQEKRPDKKVYRLTEEGRAVLHRELTTTQPQHRVKSEFLVLMYFSHLLPPERLAQVIDQMTDEWQRCLDQDILRCERMLTQSGAPAMSPGQAFGLGYGKVMLTAALTYVSERKAALLRDLQALEPPSAAAAE